MSYDENICRRCGDRLITRLDFFRGLCEYCWRMTKKRKGTV